jgi:glycine cleavage system aminomethyltransferase T
MRIHVDGAAVEAREGEDVLTALVRANLTPAGCLCFGGDCPNCLATVDGVTHVRMCQTPASERMTIAPFPVAEAPPIPEGTTTASTRRRFEHADVVIIGGGHSGSVEAARLRAGGQHVIVIDAAAGDEALGLYAGPEVVARIDGEVVRLHATEVVVATGAAAIHPVVPGAHLTGILTAQAATRLAHADIDLGRVVSVGAATEGVESTVVQGAVVRFEGTQRIEAVVVAEAVGVERRHECDTVVVDLGTYPRDVLARMLVDERIRVVGGAAGEATIPACPTAGVVCPCAGVTVEDLDFVWDRGFRVLELLKRATLAGTGTCQGGVCTPYLRSFVADRGEELQPTFTARPLARQMTIGEAAAGSRMPPIHRTGLDAVHRRLGARMDRIGGWWRPWRYESLESDAEYWAVRQAVSLGDVSTLGKVIVRGPDAAEFLEHIYPCRVSDMGEARSRYALVLAESGGVLDDGLISRVDETTFALTFTSGGASLAEAWLRDWAHSFQADVRIMDRTHSLAAINVTGPRATELMERAGLDEPIRFMRHARAVVAGIECRVFRLSFTGEVSYELHHPVSGSAHLWEELTRLGEDLGIQPHGLETLQRLRLEKGHIIIGMDTEPDSTPRRLDMEWAVKMDKGDFVGRSALERTGRQPLDRRLVGLTMPGAPPTDGTSIWLDGDIAGYVTSATWSPVLEQSVMLAWVHLIDGAAPETVPIGAEIATLVSPPFYDPEGARARS